MRCLCCWLLVICSWAADDAARLAPIVEVRGGHTSVWGLEAHLGRYHLRDLQELKRVIITERKYDHDITAMFRISTDVDMGVVTLRFHDSQGDFGTGNIATVTIPVDAFREPRPAQAVVLEMTTDVPASGK